MRTVAWRDGEPVNDEYVRGEFDALTAVVGDRLDAASSRGAYRPHRRG
nr:DUF6735 family protein [Halarchaeum acidiphilum]